MTQKRKPRWEYVKPILVLIILTACAVMLFYGFKETDVELVDKRIEIKGMYGLEVDFANVENVTLIGKSMQKIGVGTRTNGFGGLGSTLKGNFKSDNLGKHMLFVDADAAPTIRIERKNGVDIYISFKDSKKTETLFSELSKESLCSR